MKRAFTVLAGICAAHIAAAGPLQPRHIPANALWFTHTDFDRLRASEIGRHLLAEMQKPETEAKFAAFQLIFNFDPRHSLRGLSLYGAGVSPSDAVALVAGEFDAARLVTLARAAQGHRSINHRQHEIHSWIDEKRITAQEPEPRTHGAIHPSGIVIFGQKTERVAEALDVLDNLKPSLAGPDADAAFGAVVDTAFFQAAGRYTEIALLDPRAALLQNARLVSFAVGPTDGDVQISLQATAADEQTARHMHKVAQGLVALTALQHARPNSARLADATTVTLDGATVTVTVRLPVAEAIEMMQQRKPAPH
jgi:hypothetical protein